ncbi:MAG: GH92 family glycosyl hydrolase, partial [Ferruginibacter sp.]|nr:GH92 family glycosyl hydrolase [Ferruginibacter sp.]
GCGGYHYTDNFIYGFSRTHLSGTGVSDYGDILLMPTAKPSNKNSEYGSLFSHANEKASAGFYQVFLQDDKIGVQLTATERVGFHKYIFNGATDNFVMLDLKHRDEVLESSLKMEDSFTVSGLRRSKAWAVNQYVYFTIKFSSPITNWGVWDNEVLNNEKLSAPISSKNIKAFFKFNTAEVFAKVAISPVSVEGAKKNLDAEVPHWDFEKTKQQAQQKWNTELSKIEIESTDVNKLTIFYTALYHTQIVPNINMDVDGQYRGMDNKIHKAEGFTYYSVFSLWDTYRATHPLYNIIDRKRNLDYIKTFLVQYQQGGRLPVWELASNETDCMIGYHSVSVIADAYVKGVRGFDTELALEAMKKSATWNHLGLPALMQKGVLEMDDEHESVSKLLEYAYDDWCIATFAKALGKEDDYKTYIKRSQYWKNIYNTKTGFMHPRKNGDWIYPFEPREVNNNFTEANSWQYSFYTPHDIGTYIKTIGGEKNLEKKLDALFTAPQQTTGREQSDITGLIGQYAHGNEPSHHIAYLYPFAGAAYKTEEKVNFIVNNFYKNDPDGLIGNEDCGQMSAWYVMSALGFYSVLPGGSDLIFGTPTFEKATINLEDGKKYVVKANNLSEKNYYVQGVQFFENNGAEINSLLPVTSLNNSAILNGGQLVFNMDAKPNISNNKPTLAYTVSDNNIVVNPIIEGGGVAFSNSKKISISSPQENTTIYYTTNGDEPTIASKKYTSAFVIDKSLTVKAIAVNADGIKSFVTTAKYIKKQNNYTIKLNTPYEPQYDGGGKGALIDGISGDINWRKGNWQGYQNVDMDVVISLNKLTAVSQVQLGCLQDIGAWIIYPKEIQIATSVDGKTFKTVYTTKNSLSQNDVPVSTHNFMAAFKKIKATYIKITAKQYGTLPAWHLGAGGQSHIFVDEVIIK